MDPDAVTNIVGAFAVALADAVEHDVVAAVGDHSPTTVAALVHLSKYGGARIDDLRRPLGLSHPGCVRLVDRLERVGLVERGGADDRRAVAVRLTRAGAATARAILRSRAAAVRTALDALSPRQRRTLGALASKMLAASIRDEAHALRVCRLCDYGACPDDVCPAAKALAQSGP